MGLYEETLVSSPLFLSMRMVLLVFQTFGVQPVAHIMIKSMWMVSWNSAGNISRSSLTMPPRPGDLLFARVLIHSVKAPLSRMEL